MTRNLILKSLPDADRTALLDGAELVELRHRYVLFDLNRPVECVYFIETGIASIVSVLRDGTAVETATVGFEGMTGLPVFLDSEQMSAQCFVQVSGEGWRVRADHFKRVLDGSPELRRLLNRYTQSVMTFLAQTSACNRRHSMEERCARWLLLTHDRVGRDTFDLTHLFLSQMLGVRRASVTVAAGILQKAGLIEYTRGSITVTNRKGLEEASCECYRIICNESARLVGGHTIEDPCGELTLSEEGMTLAGYGEQ